MAAVRIAGVNLPGNNHAWIALSGSIYGIGRTTAYKICAAANVDSDKKFDEMLEDEVERIRAEVARIQVEGDKRREDSMNIKRKVDLKCYQGMRHRRGLPVHGQRTKTNARTRKGKRKAIRGN